MPNLFPPKAAIILRCQHESCVEVKEFAFDVADKQRTIGGLIFDRASGWTMSRHFMRDADHVMEYGPFCPLHSDT